MEGKIKEMKRWIAFLRAINAGEGRSVKMHTLRQLFESLGFSKVESFIASGNMVFETAEQDAKTIEKKIEVRLRDELGYAVATFIRDEAELAGVADYDPFPKSAMDPGADLNIIFLPDPLDDAIHQKVMALNTDTDEFCVHGREIYWLRRRKPGGSTFASIPIGKVLGRPFTIRGSRTVKKMADMYAR